MDKYDFSTASEFLDECVSQNELYADIQESLRLLTTLDRSIDKKAFGQIWHTLLTCADLVDAIKLR